MRIWILLCHFDAEPDQNPTFHFDAEPDPDLSFQIKAQNHDKCSNRLIFHTFWLVISKLMRIHAETETEKRSEKRSEKNDKKRKEKV